MNVEVVDFRADDAPEAFTRSLRQTGFAVLVNHPLPQDLVEQIYTEWLAFFDGDRKYAYRYSDDDQDGYFGPDVSETAKGNTVKDIKEFFHVYPWGQYPSEVSDAALRYAEIAKGIALTLLGWVQDHTPDDVRDRLSMPLPQMMDGSTRTLLRVLRYPPLRGDEPADAVRAAEDFAAAVGRGLGPLLTLADEGLLDGGRVDAAPMFARAAVPAGGEAQLDLDPQPQVVSTAVEATFALEA